MYVEGTRPAELDVHQSYKSGQLLLETAKMHGLNELNFNKIWSKEEENENVPSTNSNLPLADTRAAIRFMIKKTRRFDHSIRLNEFEEVERNHLTNEEMDRIQDETIGKISSSMYRMFCARMTQTSENQKETPGNQKETPVNQEETPGNQKETPVNQEETPGNQKETPVNQEETPGNQKEPPGNQQNTPTKENESDFVFLKPKVYHCYYCHKVFFHPTIYRRHTIHQMKKLRWCSVCKRGFVSKVWFKKHRLFCHVP